MDKLYTHVLVPTDFQPECQAAYQLAFATALGSGAKVTLLHLLGPRIPEEYTGLDAIRLMHKVSESRRWSVQTAEEEAAEREQIRERLRAEIAPEWKAKLDIRCEVRRAEDAVAGISKFAKEFQVDLIVNPSPRPGLLPSFGWGVSDRLARATGLPIVRVTPSNAI